MKFTLGADPECFVGNASGVKSIIGKVGGSKEAPMPLPLGNGYAVQEDNVAMEFNIPPAATKGQFVTHIVNAHTFLQKHVKAYLNLDIVTSSAEIFPEEELQDPAAMVFGCDPDYNAWLGGKENPKPKADDWRLRSCGGHLHIGTHEVSPIIGTKACDLALGVPSVVMDKGALRKQLYGKPGAFRPKPFGFEYRVLSNFWIFHPKLVAWAYNGVNKALKFVEDGVEFDDYGSDIQKAINNNDVALAEKLIKKFRLEVVYA
jgi:hypothetical protein